ncbi:MAG: cell envelope integrity protein TolA [Prevotella sp.]|nr:cell envelope integrity protein TolA [Prevotella sp.]
MKKTMILALSAMMMAAGSVTVNAQEKVVTLDQLLKKNQEQKQAQTPQKQEQKAKPETKQQTQKQPKEKAQKQPKSSAAAAGLMAPVGFSTVYLQYNFESQKVKSGSHSDSESGNSVSAGYNYAFPISGTLPLYVEAGIAAKYVWQNENGRKFNMLSAKVPVNLLFSYPVNESFSIEPYAGLYLRGNIFGKIKYDGQSDGGYSYDIDDDDDYWDDDDMVDDWDSWSESRALASSDDGNESLDIFSKDDMGDAACKRIQLGMQFGVRARINKQFLIGVGYSMDLTNISKYTLYNTDITSKFHSFDITLGYCF